MQGLVVSSITMRSHDPDIDESDVSDTELELNN